jgi:hypothetical protein
MTKVLSILNHTLIAGIILMIFGAVGTYFIVPVIQNINERNRITREEKVKKISEFIKNNENVNSQLNNIQTMLEIFYKDFRDEPNIHFNKDVFYKEKECLRKRVNEKYVAFDNEVWWWYWSLFKETDANTLINKKKLDILKKYLTEYGQNMDESMRLLSPIWDNFCRQEKRPDAGTNRILDETRKTLNGLREKRDSIIGEILKLYTPS